MKEGVGAAGALLHGWGPEARISEAASLARGAVRSGHEDPSRPRAPTLKHIVEVPSVTLRVGSRAVRARPARHDSWSAMGSSSGSARTPIPSLVDRDDTSVSPQPIPHRSCTPASRRLRRGRSLGGALSTGDVDKGVNLWMRVSRACGRAWRPWRDLGALGCSVGAHSPADGARASSILASDRRNHAHRSALHAARERREPWCAGPGDVSLGATGPPCSTWNPVVIRARHYRAPDDVQ